MERTLALQHWLAGQIAAPFTLSEPIGDASGRRYFRVRQADGTSLIAMDAPTDRVDCRPFLSMAVLLQTVVRVPAIRAQDLEQGFLLLDDLGEADLQAALAGADEATARRHYLGAIDALVAMQAGVAADAVPDYSATQMHDDLERFAEWYAGQHLGKPLAGDDLAVWERCRALLVAHAQSLPKAVVHFDYHSRNLLAGEPVGVIDFQDARRGPLTYDLVSLLKDAYVVWPEDFRLDLCIRYWQKARAAGLPVAADFDSFYMQFEWTGAFRHVRTLGTFARLIHRDGKPRYIDDMPATLAYLRETCNRYAELRPLGALVNRLTGFKPTVAYTF